ncbi:MAG: VWA domain-containing protein [Dysgonamonadaceae bacterium]|jgi:hypothetical protein|nr:VWA domain-containing protein [Dysgonamonadaceae bacterium]
MKNLRFVSIMLIVLIFCNCQQGKSQVVKNEPKIQVAILLDTSNSMDGLIDQAKSRLWNIVNTLSTLKFKGKTPEIQIALYEYGNDGLSSKSGYIRKVTSLTTDLDLISEKLFALTTNGGLEYCGAVIQKATLQLEWSNNDADMKLIYIAGNEEFNQGNVNYKEAIRGALAKNIYVNTIYCGDHNQGIRELWKSGADAGKGKYFNINSDEQVQFITTPYDDRITACNERLNKTYISYGTAGVAKQQNQVVQDKNAQKMSSSNYAERVVSKSKSAYKNDSWDLVDKVNTDSKALSSIQKEELPKELQNKSTEEINVIIAQKSKERETIQKEIDTLAKQRQAYIDAESKKAGKGTDDLGKAINASILAFANTLGYQVEK